MSATETPVKPTRTPPKPMPLWKVIVHNDDVNTFNHVIHTFMEIVYMDENEAIEKTGEVHHQGLSVVSITHKEKAEFLMERLMSKRLTVTIEPDA